MVGDSDGIIIINPKDAPEILKKAIAKLAKEQAIIKAIKERVPRDKSWVDKALEKVGCEYIDDVYQ